MEVELVNDGPFTIWLDTDAPYVTPASWLLQECSPGGH